jgi:hypothetical protein
MYVTEWSQDERDELTALLSGGTHAARKFKRAQILLAADAGASDEDIAISIAPATKTSPSASPSHDPRNYTLLVPGQSTAEDAIRLLGPPSVSSSLATGKALLQWAEYRLPKIHAVVAFDADGWLVEVRHVFVD